MAPYTKEKHKYMYTRKSGDTYVFLSNDALDVVVLRFSYYNFLYFFNFSRSKIDFIMFSSFLPLPLPLPLLPPLSVSLSVCFPSFFFLRFFFHLSFVLFNRVWLTSC
ncbi:hypothetical protein, unlikely [Trypanosoma brucei gambiense DAL972]|uniref:Uncharacterized protein n=1 Tax=Trypanosoma brucei gambiense (strain MHOM/CI/86/DAL972) TaxID=679716 RepID=D0A5H7_TRYB9|nr:hypothetical protein, unlikely [Trypanosoma brucei gambiense DAL972]CBH16928.1 hypothetical protein, unlikely [Trypanosoma brucei gambiense DAL972]|eukprot:XP_011779192.1 hypothetical protein, unlikely [Trypanosoma brucei gambiense DAL972]